MKKVHLICNAHMDPVWQWNWPEGLGAALSTFRVAVDFAEEVDNFVFNHNEALLYEWVEEHDPKLFERIRNLVRAGKWRIMGGWYLQPDCNMPSGESIVRQIMVGREYFKKKFDVEVETAVNVDCFGHSKGLVQILELADYKNYLFMRPDPGLGLLDDLPQKFCWEGYAGSRIVGYRLNTPYNTLFGTAAQVVENYITDHIEEDNDIMRFWGIGDHGGGPSRIDLTNINALIERKKSEVVIEHSSPDDFFAGTDIDQLPKFTRDLNPIDAGCYTSMHRVKQLHRKLENNLLIAEKTSSLCEMEKGKTYPTERLAEAWKDVLFCEFHDILPGTCVKSAEEDAVQRLHHGLEITDRIIVGNLYSLAQNEPASVDGNIPIMVLNPHPYEITDDFECEFMLADQNWENTFTSGVVYDGEHALPTQVEKEQSSMNLDWRKKISFHATLRPMSLNRFDCHLKVLPKRPFEITDLQTSPEYIFDNGKMQCVFDTHNGTLKKMIIDGTEYIGADFGALLVYNDDCDPWLINRSRIDSYNDRFSLLDRSASAAYAACKETELSPIRIIEDGPVRTCIEVLLGYANSLAKVTYYLPKNGIGFSVDYLLHWNEKDKMVRANFSHCFQAAQYTGQDMFGIKQLTTDYEMVAQKWVCASDETSNHAMGVINNCCYGFMLDETSIKPSLLRAPTYTCHQINDRERLPLNRYYPRMDQGEANFRFTIIAGSCQNVTEQIDRLAQTKNESPLTVSYFPNGGSHESVGLFRVDGVRMDTCKKCNSGDGYILRLYNDKNRTSEAKITIERLGVFEKIMMLSNEIKTFWVTQGRIEEVHLITEK